MFSNVPALARAPFALGLEVVCDVATQSFNTAIGTSIINLTETLPDFNAAIVDMYTGYEEVGSRS